MQGGNLYNKYSSKIPLVKFLMKNYFRQFDFLFSKCRGVRSILDVGCGEGYIIKYIKNKYDNKKLYLEGVDLSEDVINIAKKNNPGVKFSKGDIYCLNYKDNSFDLVLATEVLEHLEKPEEALKELRRVSRKYIILSVPREPPFRIANILRLKYLKRLGNTPGHIQNWTRKNFEKLLSKHFKKIIIKTAIIWTLALCIKN